MKKNELTIGRTLKPRGLKGTVKIEIYSGDGTRYAHIKHLIIDGKTYGVLEVSVEGGFIFALLDGINTAESADLLRGKEVSALRADLPAPPEGHNYIVDMLGSTVIVGSDTLGELVDIMQYGSADVYVVKPLDGVGTVSFPALKELIRSVDVEKGEILLEPYLFRRVAVINE